MSSMPSNKRRAIASSTSTAAGDNPAEYTRPDSPPPLPPSLSSTDPQRRRRRNELFVASLLGNGADAANDANSGIVVDDGDAIDLDQRRRRVEKTSGIESMFGGTSRRAFGQRNARRPFEHAASGLMAQSDVAYAAAHALMSAAAQSGILSTEVPFDVNHGIANGDARGHALVPYANGSNGLDSDDDDDNNNNALGDFEDDEAAAIAAGAAAAEEAQDRVHLADGEVLERAPGDGNVDGAGGGGAAPIAAPGISIRVGSSRPPKNYLAPPTRRLIETVFGTPGMDDECYICERNSSTTRGLPAQGVQRLMEAFQELEGQEHKSIEVRVKELHKVFVNEVKAEIDENARMAFKQGWVAELRLCPDYHPVKLWEHFYDTHGKGNQMGNVIDVTIARVAESANTIYHNHHYYLEETPDGRKIEMVDKDSWRMLREHTDLLLRLSMAKAVRDGCPASGVASGRSKTGGVAPKAIAGGGGGGGGGRKEVSARTVKLFGDAIGGPRAVYGRPSDIKMFRQATGALGSASSKRGDEKS